MDGEKLFPLSAWTVFIVSSVYINIPRKAKKNIVKIFACSRDPSWLHSSHKLFFIFIHLDDFRECVAWLDPMKMSTR